MKPESAAGSPDALIDYQKRLAQLEGELASNKEIKREIDRLERASADPGLVLHLLAMEIKQKMEPEGKPKWKSRWLADMRRRRANLGSVARRLKDIATEVESAYADDWNHPDFVMLSWLLARDDHPVSASERIPREEIAGMRDCARHLQEKAEQFGELSKYSSPRLERRPVQSLLAHIQQATGNALQHLPGLSLMLHEAYRQFDIKKPANQESLEKVLRRHVLAPLKAR
jgi:hypothetical protein